MKVGGGSISGVASGDLGRAEESGRRAPGLAQLQSSVAHQLCRLGQELAFSLWASVPLCVYIPGRGAGKVYTEGLDILEFWASEI